ncbi:MAG: cyclic nucleotide-binding domain-containing protein [Pseudomonadota bacterium]
MSLEVIRPAPGSRIVRSKHHAILFGQPPEVLKGLLSAGITHFDTLVLPDSRERDGSLLNNLEFPLYFFLFVAGGLHAGQKLNLVGDAVAISQALRLLRFTLLGPTEAELIGWGTAEDCRREWLRVSQHLALSDADGNPLPVESFFNLLPFADGKVVIDGLLITHTGNDRYRVEGIGGAEIKQGHAEVNLLEDKSIFPTYHVQPDYVPGGLVKMGLEVLGGASGFTLDEPCTGLALCYNGDYLLIDSLPFLDQNLFARGIAKNQVSAVFLTHLHDDHCAMFPLMLMPHRVEVITTREIFEMAMEKLACNLGWQTGVIREHFKLVEVTPGETFNYFGLLIEPHLTVHSVPTIGATFTTIHKGYRRSLCVVGDNHSMTAVRAMTAQGLVRRATLENLERLYTQRFNMLVADGGAGAIHGDPADAISSNSDRVVFVHVEELATEFNTTFSLASSGKRYNIIEGDQSIYTSQVNHYLTTWLGRPFPNRWMRSLLAEEEIRRYNQGDVIIVQDAETRGFVYLILTGYCDVVQHDGKRATSVAHLQAGDMIGEMAVISGRGTRNASVVATTPVTVCVFSEEIFRAFITTEGFAETLEARWSMRPLLKQLPQFSDLSTTAFEQLAAIGRRMQVEAGASHAFAEDAWCLMIDGKAAIGSSSFGVGAEFGWRPFGSPITDEVFCEEASEFVLFDKTRFETTRLEVPQLNYRLRKYRTAAATEDPEWILGTVTTL